jgi:hypothetical protein
MPALRSKTLVAITLIVVLRPRISFAGKCYSFGFGFYFLRHDEPQHISAASLRHDEEPEDKVSLAKEALHLKAHTGSIDIAWHRATVTRSGLKEANYAFNEKDSAKRKYVLRRSGSCI